MEVMDELTWMQFTGNNVIVVARRVVILMLAFKLIEIFFDEKIAKAYGHILNMCMYTFLICIFYVGFKKIDGALENLSISAGFTFIFGVMQIVDNVLSALQVYIKPHNFKKRASIKREKNNFTKFHSNLQTIYLDAKPGYVQDTTVELVKEVREYTCNNTFKDIDSVICWRNKEESLLSKTVPTLMQSKGFRKINEGTDVQIILNYYEAEDLKEKIDNVLKSINTYTAELVELKKLVRNINIVDEME